MPRHTPLATVALCLALSSVLSSTARAQLPVVRITSIAPSGGQQGSTLDFKIEAGADLDGIDRLYFTHPGITAVQKRKPVEGQPEPQPVPNEFEVTIAPDVPVGLHDVRAIGAFGISNPRVFIVGSLPETAEVEPNETAAQATPAALESIVNGRFAAARDVDFVKFSAKAGQLVVAEVWSERMDAPADATLELYDSAGTQLAVSRDRIGLDPLIAYKIPADGEYFVRLYDFQFAGGAEHNWRLSLSTGPHVETVFPPVAQAGTQPSVRLLGHNLPGGQPGERTMQGDTLEMLGVPLDVAPDAASAGRFAWQSFATAAGASVDWHSQTVALGSSQVPVAVSVSPHPVVVEQEPNDIDKPQAITVPCELAGQFDPAGDIDYYEFDLAEKQTIWIESFADRLGSPADPYVVLQAVSVDKEGKANFKDVLELDDTPLRAEALLAGAASRDARATFTAEKAGRFRLLVRDLYGDSRGDARLVYRISLRPDTPDFRLSSLATGPGFSLGTVLVRRGGTAGLLVSALRRDSFTGPIFLSAEGLPPGVTCPETVIGTGAEFSILAFAAAEDAAPFEGPVRIVGRAKIGDAEVERECRAATVCVIRGQPAARMARENALAVGPLAPLGVSTSLSKVSIVAGQRVDVPVSVVRREGFAGPVTFSVLPPKTTDVTAPFTDQQTAGVLPIYFPPGYAPGVYSFQLAGAAKVPSPRKDDKGNVIAVDVNELTTPIVVEVAAAPLVMTPELKDNGIVKQGAAIDVPVKLERAGGFAGPITLDLLLPPGVTAGFTAPEVVAPADAATATLQVTVAGDVAPGAVAQLYVRAHLEFQGKQVEVDAPLLLNVQAK